MIARPVAIALAIALALSVLANLLIGDAWLEARDAQLQAVGQRDQAQGSAKACSAGVEQLQRAARDRQADAARAIAAAQASARGHQQRAQQILSAPPAVPGDACASAGAALDAWLQERPRK